MNRRPSANARRRTRNRDWPVQSAGCQRQHIDAPPSNRTYHLMAKAAVAVLEAVADEKER